VSKPVGWSRLLVEGAVIVASILIAFMIDAAWDLRSDLADEQDLLRAIELDMIANRQDIDRVIANHRRAMAATDLFLELTPDQLLRLSQDSVDLVSGLTGTSSFDPSDASLANANLASLRDLGLLQELGTWSRQLTNERAAAGPLDNAIWELRTVGGEVAPEFFIDGPTREGLRSLRSSPRFVGVQIALQMLRTSDARLLTRLGIQTDSVLALVRRNRRDGSD